MAAILKELYKGQPVQDLSAYQDFLDAKRTAEEERKKKKKRDAEKAKKAVDGFEPAGEPSVIVGDY